MSGGRSPRDRGGGGPRGHPPAVGAALLAFRVLRLLLPSRLRRRHGTEMEAMLTGVLAEAHRRAGIPGLLGAAGREASDLLSTAADSRLGRTGLARGPVATLAAAALALAAFTALGAPDRAGPVVRFEAHDPAGSFTLVVRDGRVVGATLDGVPVPAHRVLQRGDSVRLVGARGRPGVRVFFERPATIRWEARRPAGDGEPGAG